MHIEVTGHNTGHDEWFLQEEAVPFGQNAIRFFLNLLLDDIRRDASINQLFP